MFITAVQHQKHSTQSSNSYSPRGNWSFLHSAYAEMEPVSRIENSFYPTPKQQPASVSSCKGAAIIFLMNCKIVKTNKIVTLYLKRFFNKKFVSS